MRRSRTVSYIDPFRWSLFARTGKTRYQSAERAPGAKINLHRQSISTGRIHRRWYIYRSRCLFRGNAERPESRMYIQEYRGGVSLEMDDQVIRVKRANDCPALLKSFRWKAAREEVRARRRTGGGSSMGSRVDEVFIMAPLPGAQLFQSSFILRGNDVDSAPSRGATCRNSQIHSRLRRSGLREGSFRVQPYVRQRAFRRSLSRERVRQVTVGPCDRYFSLNLYLQSST